MAWTSIPGTAGTANPPAAEATPPKTYKSVQGTENLPPSGSIFSSTNNPKPANLGALENNVLVDTARSAPAGLLGQGVPMLANTPSSLWNISKNIAQSTDKYMPEFLQDKNIDTAIQNNLPSWLQFLKSGDPTSPDYENRYDKFTAPDLYTPTRNLTAKLTGGGSEYQPKYLPGQLVSKAMSFAPAAATVALTGGATLPEALGYGAVVPALAGSAANPVATSIAKYAGLKNPEAWGTGAQIAAELLSPAAASRFGRIGSPILPGARDRVTDLSQLESLGIKPTAAPFHAPGAPREKAFASELSNPIVKKAIDSQNEQFTLHILDNVGIDAQTAAKHGQTGPLTSDNMSRVVFDEKKAVGDGIGKLYQLAVNPTSSDYSALSTIRKKFGISNPVYNIPFGEEMHLTRQALNEILYGTQEADKIKVDSAHRAIQEIDNIYANKAGLDNAEELAKANDRFSKMMLIQRAFDKDGLISPHNMTTTIAQASSNPQAMARISELAKTYLIQNGIKPTVDAIHKALGWLMTGGSGLLPIGGLSAYLFGISHINTAIGSAVGAITTLGTRGLYNFAKNSKMGTRIGQNVSRNQGIYGNVPIPPVVAPSAVTETGNYVEQPAPYKRGGAVRTHDMEADQLVRAAERAKKGWNAETEPLLKQSDDAVAHALEVANRSI